VQKEVAMRLVTMFVLVLFLASTPGLTSFVAQPDCDDPDLPNVTDLEVRQPPDLPEPPARVPFRDPEFGTCIVRVTDSGTDIEAGDASRGMKNEYSRVQAFNADGSRILVRGLEATWYLYDAASLEPLGMLPFGGAVAPRWDPEDPHLVYYSEETRLLSYRTDNGEIRMIHDFSTDFPDQTLAAVWTRWEGSPSADGRYWGFMAEDEDWLATAFLVYDLEEDRVISTLDVRHWSDDAREVDSVTMSPRGTYFLAYLDAYCERGRSGSMDQPCGLMVYDRGLTEGRSLLRIVGHSDVALDAAGNEVMVYQDIDEDTISMLDLASGEITPLWAIDFSSTPIGLHFSGQSFDRPGWVLISTYDGDPVSYTWMDDQVFAVELVPNGRVVRLAHTHSLVDEEQEHDYWVEPHASVNRDFTRVVFTSNWGRSGIEEVEMYLIHMEPGWLETLP
jgi:hypothetical protein